jgi:hypothetical protein
MGCPQTVPVHNAKSWGPQTRVPDIPLSRHVRGTGHMSLTAKFGPTLPVPLCWSPHRGILPSVTSWSAIFQSALLPWLPARRLRLNPNALVLACVQTLCRSLVKVSAEITQTPPATKIGAKLRCLQISKQNHQISCWRTCKEYDLTPCIHTSPGLSSNSTSCSAQAAQNP